MDERVMRIRTASVMQESVIHGSTKCLSDVAPYAGNHLSFKESASISTRPSQKFGIAVRTMEKIVLTSSMSEYCLTAEISPTGTPIMIATSVAPIAR